MSKKGLRSRARNFVFNVYQRILDEQGAEHTIIDIQPCASVDWGNFTKWVTEKLIPNFTKPSLIVMDNAKYHSVQLNKPPTQADRIAVIKEWIQSNNIPYDDNWRKCQLLEAVKNHKSDAKYQIKLDKNVNRLVSDIISLTEEALSQIGIDEWRISCAHEIKIENQFIEQDRLIEMQKEWFIINTASSSSDEDFFMDVEYMEPFSSSDSL